MEKLAAYADRVLLLHEGTLIQDGKPEEVFSRDDLNEFGIEPPIFVKIARALGLRNEKTGLYPISLEEMPVKRNIQFHTEDIKEVTNSNTVELLVRDLHFSYTKGQDVIRGLNVSLTGEPIAIIGQNGAGKTTFVKLLKALLKPDSGEILLNGESTASTTAAKLASRMG